MRVAIASLKANSASPWSAYRRETSTGASRSRRRLPPRRDRRPPAELAIVRSAIPCADEVIVPKVRTPLDLDRLDATLDPIAEVDALNSVRLHLLLTRVRRGTRSARETRAASRS